MKLSLYNKKRNFKKTPEPKGKVSRQAKNIYVIQKHAASHLHYDFRLEMKGVLLSWAVPKGPCLDPTVKRLAMHVEDHPVDYAHFEGIIPKGQYGGGTVMLWDEGTWESEDENPEKAYREGHLRFTLHGKKLKGRWNLIRFKKDDEKPWFLIKSKDKYAEPLNKYDILIKKPNSVLSKETLDEIAENYKNIWSDKGLKKVSKKKKIKISVKKKSSFPKKISPELATLVDKPPSGDEWVYEIKLDGYRIITFKENEEIKLMSRNHRDWTAHFLRVVAAIRELPIKNAILDGEIVLLDKHHRSNFQMLQNAVYESENKPFIYYIFDLLYYDQYNLMSLPLAERKHILQKMIPAKHAVLRYNDHIVGDGANVFVKACEMGLEGIIAKKSDSKYEERRTKSWLKLKCKKRQEFIIGGYTPPKNTRGYFGSLYLGYYDKKGVLKYCGNVGTGFNSKTLKNIYEQLKKYKTDKNPFNSKPPGVMHAVWVEPKLIAEVEFIEWTNEGILRHPSFKGLRSDKPAIAVTREVEKDVKKMNSNPEKKIGKIDLPFKFTNPNKILYAEDEITKYDLAIYYEEIHQWILPYIINRPLTIVRCPESYKDCFYQKHINKSTPKYLYGIDIKEKYEIEKCIYIKDRVGLLALVQLGTLEIHPWGSRIKKVEYPDMITIDLDPSPEVLWKEVVHTAKLLRNHLQKIKLKSFVKTTGGKGLHVVIPIKPEYRWDQVKNFSEVLVKFMVSHHPEKYVSNMSKAKRKGKIFIDYLRNQRGATAISAYSTRAREHAPVSTPLDWDELTNNKEDTSYTIATLPKRLKNLRRDPWKDFFKVKQSLKIK